MKEQAKDEEYKKIRKDKLKKKIIEHLKEDMDEARIGIVRDKGLTRSLKKSK